MSKQNQRVRRFHLEAKFEMNGRPYVAVAEGVDLEAALSDAEFHVDCPDPKTYVAIGELPQHLFDRICKKFAEQIADALEQQAEASA